MQCYINTKRIDYILYHLSFHLSEETYRQFKSRIVFSYYDKEIKKHDKKIVFPLSSSELDIKQVININNIPVLFPVSQLKIFYSISHKNLIFQHDLLKSAFYLLSGYQEFNTSYKDSLGRFPYNESIHYKLNIINKPLVNYYFEIILNGLEEFFKINGIPFQRRNIFDHWRVMLTHDVDRLDTYTIFDLVSKIKSLLGVTPSKFSKFHQIRLSIRYFMGLLTRSWNNPHWEFDRIRRLERSYGFHSVFFFLRNEQLHKDSYYQYDEGRLKKLFTELTDENCEIGMHATVNSAMKENSMRYSYQELLNHSPQEIYGVRQHMLKFIHPHTLLLQEKVGLKYDTTLGFAAHEGFRNSYCLPFKLYDFNNERIIDIWEIPLIVMDATLFNYRNLSPEGAYHAVKNLISEISKFKGVLTILWHNGYGIDFSDQNIRYFYGKILELLFNYKNIKSILGKEVVNILNQMENK